MASKGGIQRGWGLSVFSITVLLLLVFWLYRETAAYLVSIWNGEYAHAYLVLPISLYLILKKRKVLAGLHPCPNIPALFAIAVASLLWLSSMVTAVQMVQSVSMLMLVMASTWVILGGQVMRHLAFPILFLGFAIPIWSLLSPALQELTADIAFWLIRLAGVPALREGHQIILPAGQFSVEEACSGLRYLLAGLTLGVLYAYLNYRRARTRFLVVAIAAGTAIVANIVRVFVVIYLGYKTEMQHPWVNDHLYLGWYLFGGAVFLLLLVDVWMHRRIAVSVQSEKMAEDPPPGIKSCPLRMPSRILVLVASAALVATGPAFSIWLERQATAVPDGRLVFPAAFHGWEGIRGAKDDWEPHYPGSVAEKSEYRNDGSAVFVYVAYYPAQSQGRELINDLNRIQGKAIWKASAVRHQVGKISGLPVLERRLTRASGQKRLVWYWYEVAGWRTTNRYEAKLFQVAGLFTGRSAASIIAVATDYDDEVANARNRLDSFVSAAEFPVFAVMETGG